MRKIQLLKKASVFLVGLYFISIGIVFSVHANLGVTPISSLPYVYDLATPLTLGQAMIILNLAMMALQILLLRRAYRLYQLVQFPLIFLFGLFIDMNVGLFDWVSVHGYLAELLLCLASCLVIGFGVFLQFKADLTFLPVEGVAWAISRKFHTEFSKIKICIDATMVGISLVSSLVLLPHIEGVREGTILAVLAVGYSVKVYDGLWRFISGRQSLSATMKQT